jgi:hypothetical protein
MSTKEVTPPRLSLCVPGAHFGRTWG